MRVWAAALLRTARPGFGAQCLEELARQARERAGERLDVTRLPRFPRVLGSSSFLARQLLRHPAWIAELAGALPDAPPAHAIDADWDAIRAAKYTGLLRIAARDLLGRPFERQPARALGPRRPLPRGGARVRRARDRSRGARPARARKARRPRAQLLLRRRSALRLRACPAAADALEHNHAVARLIRALQDARSSSRSEDGFGYRVDLDLRPEGRTGVLANPVDVALGYYEGFGAEWERQMLIRLRPVAGPRASAARFAREIAPFVYRRADRSRRDARRARR